MSDNSIPFFSSKIRIAKKAPIEVPPPKADPNKITVKIDPTKVKMSPEELQENMKANRGTGYHVNKKDKRKNNPFKTFE